MPVAAVIGFGMPVMSVGSSAVAIGTSFGSMTADFARLTGSVTRRDRHLEPVPAVVGIANSGLAPFITPTRRSGVLPLTAIARR